LFTQAGLFLLENDMATAGRAGTVDRTGASGDVLMDRSEVAFSIDDTAAGRDVLSGIELDIEVPRGPVDLTHEQFMAQDIEILMADAGSEDENQYAEVKVNGDYRICFRGDSAMMKRYHVEALAHAKELRMKQTRIVNPDGSMGYAEKMMSKQTYPFQVLNDPAGRKGADWLRAKLKSAH
jgi:hypothetical protein